MGVTNVPTASSGTSTDQVASTSFVKGTYTDFLASENTFTQDNILPSIDSFDNSTRGITRVVVFSFINKWVE